MRVRVMCLARYAEIIHGQNVLNIIGAGIEEIAVDSLPHVYGVPLYTVARLSLSPEEAIRSRSVKVTVLTPSGDMLLNPDEFILPQLDPSSSERFNTNFVIAFANMTFETAGTHWFVLTVGGEEVDRVPLRVRQVEARDEATQDKEEQ